MTDVLTDTEDNTLSTQEVKARLLSYGDPRTTDALYALGSTIVAESTSRTTQLDAKATSLAGYVAALLALLVAGLVNKAGVLGKTEWVLICVAGAFALVSAVCAMRALQIRKWKWFSDEAWFEKDMILKPADMLRRYHVLTMHAVNRSHESVNADKAARLAHAQDYLIFGVVALVLALFVLVGRSLGLLCLP